MASNSELSIDSFVESLNIDIDNGKPKTCFDIINLEKKDMLEARKKGVSFEVLAKYIGKKYKIKISVATIKKYLSSPKVQKINISNLDLQARQNLFIEVSKSLHGDGVATTKLFNLLKDYCPPSITEETKSINNFSSNPTERKTY